MVDTLMRARKKCEEKLWEIEVDDSDVREMLRPLQKLKENQHFMKVLPENAKLGVTVLNGLINGSDGFKHKITKAYNEDGCSCFAVPFLHYHHRYEMSKAAEQLAKDIVYLIEILPADQVTIPKRTVDLKPIPRQLVKGLKSREKLIRTILEVLQHDQVSAVGVFGMGGAGKTTLVKEVVDIKVKYNFDTILMCEISETPNIKHIQDQIAEALNLPLHDVHSLSHRAIKLYNRLKQGKGEGKEKQRKEARTLIILDNIWQKLNLEEIGIPCESTNDFCCKFLLTSREKNICQMMGVRDENIFPMGLLDETESMELFCYHVGRNILDGSYKSMAQKLLNKCGGLPLTIVATSNALKGKELSMWRHFADKLEKPISSQVSGMHHETYAILETSYNVMESEEKKMFFLIGCLCPLGSSISIENLMRYAIGLDLFQHVNRLSEAMEQASTWAVELISSSMLLETDSQGHVKIHDVVRASAISLAAKGKRKFLVEAIPRWMCKETFNKYTAISLLSNCTFISRLNGVKARMLQILLLRGDLSSTSELDGCFFEGMVNLKILHLSYMNLGPVLPKSIEKLTNLKTLNLEECKLGDISLICELMELLVLSLRDSVLEELPVQMGKLCNLRILDMRGCKVNLKRSPTNINFIASLSSLEGLYLFDSFREWAAMTIESNEIEGKISSKPILEFHDHGLTHLNLLEVSVEKPEHLPVGQFSKNLDRFKICVCKVNRVLKGTSKPFHRVLDFGEFDINNALKNRNCLEALLKRADCLRFSDTRGENNLVPELDTEGFRDLMHLEVVNGFSNMECIINTDGLTNLIAFPNLDYLRISGLESLKMICRGEPPPGMFNNLRDLCLDYLLELQYALPAAVRYCNLTEIIISDCRSLKFIFYESDCMSYDGEPEQQKEKDVVLDLPCLKSVYIHSADDLVSLSGSRTELCNKPDAGLVGQIFFNRKIMCPSLELLELEYCDKIMSLWSKELDPSTFRNLKEIRIIRCSSLQSLGFPSALVQLERLEIRASESMQVVISKETEELEYQEKIIKFSQLRDLQLHSLLNFETFYGGSYAIEFPKLKKLKLSHLPRLTAFVVSENSTVLFCDKVEFPNLEELEVTNVIKDTHTQLLAMKDVPKLRKLTLDNIKALRLIPSSVSLNLSSLRLTNVDEDNMDTVIFTTSEPSENEDLICSINSSQLPKLEQLCVEDFPRLENLFEIEGNDNDTDAMLMFCGRLKHLELKRLPKMKLLALHSFENLHSLYITELKWKYVFPSVVLEMLQDIKISYCKDMNVIVHDEQKAGSNGRAINFPRLKVLKLFGVSIHSFSSNPDASMNFPSLETVEIEFCDRLNTFCSGAFLAPKLKKVELSSCPEMKCFLSGNQTQVVKLPSLQRVSIINGCYMQFSTRPLEAPNLREVVLLECDMQWFLPGYPNDDDILELPSLEILYIKDSNLQSFTPGLLKAPKLTQVTIDKKVYSIQEIDNLNDFLWDMYDESRLLDLSYEDYEVGEDDCRDGEGQIENDHEDIKEDDNEDVEQGNEVVSRDEEDEEEGDIEDNKEIQENMRKDN